MASFCFTSRSSTDKRDLVGIQPPRLDVDSLMLAPFVIIVVSRFTPIGRIRLEVVVQSLVLHAGACKERLALARSGVLFGAWLTNKCSRRLIRRRHGEDAPEASDQGRQEGDLRQGRRREGKACQDGGQGVRRGRAQEVRLSRPEIAQAKCRQATLRVAPPLGIGGARLL